MKKSLFIFLTALLAVTLLVGSASAWGGAGTSSNPYQISSNADLQTWNNNAATYNTSYFAITADFTPSTTISNFSGNLNGNDHTLSYSRLPLFNTLGGTVSNLNFENCLVDGDGLLANVSSATVSDVNAENCFVSGNATGGIVGTATGSFSTCIVKHITVKGAETAGGIAGNGDMTIYNCHVLDSDLLAPITYGICSATNTLTKIYTIVIPSGSSNPTSKNIWWGDDATGLTEDQRNELIKDHSHFAVVKWDGSKPVVNYYLYRDNLNYRATDATCKTSSGVASDLTGTDGDVMLLYDQVWWTTAQSGNDWYITFTWNKELTDSTWVTPHRYGDSLSSTSLATYVGLGVFEGYLKNSQLRSINVTNIPTSSSTQNQYYNGAVYNRNWQYNQQLPMTYAWYVIQLYFVKGNRDVQAAYGNGIVNASSKQSINKDWSATNAWNNGTTANQSSGVTALGIQNGWGNTRVYMGETLYNNGNYIFSVLGGKDHENIERISATPSTWKSISVANAIAKANITEIVGAPEYPFFPNEGNGTTYTQNFSDEAYQLLKTNMVVYTGGYVSSGLSAGILAIDCSYARAHTGGYSGARLHVLII